MHREVWCRNSNSARNRRQGWLKLLHILGRFSGSGLGRGRTGAWLERLWRRWRRLVSRRGVPTPAANSSDSHSASAGGRPGAAAAARRNSRNRRRGSPFRTAGPVFGERGRYHARSGAAALAWLNARYDEPRGQTGVAWLDSRGHNAITTERRYRAHEVGDYMIWNQLIAGPDQMRKRMALAMSEMFVVSFTAFTSLYPSCLIAAYWDVLTAHAFGNFRQLLEALTLNAGDGHLSQHPGQSQGRLARPSARRELRARGDAALHDRPVRAQSGWHAQARCRQQAGGNLQPGRRYQSRACLHRLRLGLSIQWRHDHVRFVGKKPGAEHALRHQPHAIHLQQAFHVGGEFSRHEDHRHDARPGCVAHRARPALLSRQHRPVLRAADDPAPGDQQSITCLRAARRDGVRQQRIRRAR